jgi:pimeloyl-ACP methyl ester carboxylesterase
MKRTTLRAKLSDLERANVEASTTIFELDDRYGGPHRLVRGGTDDYFRGAAGTFKGIDDHFKGAADYYAASSAAGYLDEIRVPTLVVAALDDPWVPGGTYLTHLWRRNTHLTPLVADHGGHVGFHGKADKQPWSDIAVARFLQSEWDAA